MRDRFELWDGISVSDSIDDVKNKFPETIGDKFLKFGQYEISGILFCAYWYCWRNSDPKVKLIHKGTTKNPGSDVQNLRQELARMLGFGRGKAIVRYDGVERKIWDGKYIRAQLSAFAEGRECLVMVEFFRPLFLADNYWAEDGFRGF